MAPVVSSSSSDISLTPCVGFITQKRNFQSWCTIPRNLNNKQTVPALKHALHLSTSIRLFPQYRFGCALKPNIKARAASASGTDVAVEEAELSAGETEVSEAVKDGAETSAEPSAALDGISARAKRSRPVRRSEMPSVKNEDLIPGATFTGKVKSIQPFGAFVDFGAFTDGLVHVSRLSDDFVKDVASFVSVGQEVTVRLVEANMETGRISLTMRESDDTSKTQQQKDSPVSSDKSRSPRKTSQKVNGKQLDTKKISKFVKGQDLEGTVKNLNRAGAFISLPEGEEGFLPSSEEANEGFPDLMGGSSLDVGQEVSVRVLRITRGQVTLTMKKEENVGELDAKVVQGVVHKATNPFVIAFHSNKEISSFLDERENENELVENEEEVAKDADAGVSVTEDTLPEALGKKEGSEIIPDDSESSNVEIESIKQVEPSSILEYDDGSPPTEDQIIEEPYPAETKKNEEQSELSSQVVDLSTEIVKEAKENAVDDGVVKDESQSQTSDLPVPSATRGNSELSGDPLSIDGINQGEPRVSGDSTDQTLSVIVEEAMEKTSDDVIVKDENKCEEADSTKPSVTQGEEEPASPIAEKNETVESSSALVDSLDLKTTSAESLVAGEVGDDLGDDRTVSTSADSLQDEKAEAVMKDADVEASKVDNTVSEYLDEEKDPGTVSLNSESKYVEIEIIKQVEPSSVVQHDDGSPPTEDQITEEPSATEANENKEEAELAGNIADVPSEIVGEAKGNVVDDASMKEEDQSQTPDITIPAATQGDPELSGNPLSINATENQGEQQLSAESTEQTLSDIIEEVSAKSTDEVNSEDEDQPEGMDIIKPSVPEGEEETAAANHEQCATTESSSAVIDSLDPETTSAENLVYGEVNKNLGEDEVVIQSSADPQQNGNVSVPSGRSSDASQKETLVKAVISPALVKQLREETGAGMMDCKKALSETGGDIVKAQEYLRKKGLASADKKASRATAEGRIGSYIHDGRIGVLIEVNCETDFVARGDIFKELVEDLAMQVAACPQVQYLNAEDIPNEIVDKEKEIEMQKEDLLSKPEQIRSKIVDGRIQKRLEEIALLEQPFIKDDKVVVKDWVKQTISTIGENIKVKRFMRYNLGEGLEKKSQDFAAEVASQTAAKPMPTSAKQEPASAETNETMDKPPKATVSPSLVKQLREETGAGMMDCKKALSETGGDLVKAQEYLRKKGLSTADKKSSRLAAEGKIGSYIHDNRIGVLIEVNCETDFVGRSQNFKDLVDDLAMQVVAFPQVQYVSIEDIPESIVHKEKQLEMQREDLQSKPENIREKIVEGRITKRLAELALLEQPFIKNDSLLVKDLVKQTVAALGENIKVRRFVRFTLGEMSDLKSETEA